MSFVQIPTTTIRGKKMWEGQTINYYDIQDGGLGWRFFCWDFGVSLFKVFLNVL